MAYQPPNAAAAANYVSRARKRLREGKSITPEAQAFLDSYAAKSAARVPRTSLPSTPAPPRAPDPAPPPPSPAPTPPPPSPAPPPTPGGMQVIDFGVPQDPAGVVKAPGTCSVPNCTHTPREHGVPKCGITGEKVYPPLKPNAAKAIARGSFFITGFMIAIFRGLDEVPDPTDVELEDGADAAKDIIATRAPQLTIYSDLLAGGYALSAYSIRTMNLPKGKKEP